MNNLNNLNNHYSEYSETLKFLRQSSSNDAVQWLIEHYPLELSDYGQVFDLISHLSFKKNGRQKLAHYYLNHTYATEKPYLSFLKIMSVQEFLFILNEIYEKNKDNELFNIQLSQYQLKMIYHTHQSQFKNPKDLQDWTDFMKLH